MYRAEFDIVLGGDILFSSTPATEVAQQFYPIPITGSHCTLFLMLVKCHLSSRTTAGKRGRGNVACFSTMLPSFISNHVNARMSLESLVQSTKLD